MDKLTLLKNSDGETINFSNGINLDYDFTDYDPKKPHRISGSITIDDQDMTADILEKDFKTLLCIHFIKTQIADAYLEIIKDEYLEYIYYLTQEQIDNLFYHDKA